MTFGYLGYIWAMLGCALFGGILFGSALFLYGLARRGRADGSEPSTVVESVALREPPRPPDDAA